MSRPARRRITRDSVLFAAGLSGIAYQQVTGQVHIELLVVFGLMVGLPGLTSLLSLLGQDAATTTRSSPSPPSSSSSSSGPTG